MCRVCVCVCVRARRAPGVCSAPKNARKYFHSALHIIYCPHSGRTTHTQHVSIHYNTGGGGRFTTAVAVAVAVAARCVLFGRVILMKIYMRNLCACVHACTRYMVSCSVASCAEPPNALGGLHTATPVHLVNPFGRSLFFMVVSNACVQRNNIPCSRRTMKNRLERQCAT